MLYCMSFEPTDIITICFLASILILIEVEDKDWKRLDLFNEWGYIYNIDFYFGSSNPGCHLNYECQWKTILIL